MMKRPNAANNQSTGPLQMHNPYSPPSTKVEDTDVAKGSGVKAVVIGLLVDLGGTTLAGILLTAIYAFEVAASGVSEDELMEAMANAPLDSWVTSVGLLVGCLFSVLGGYICARIARHSEYKYGHMISAISVIIGLLVGAQMYSLFMNVALAFATWASVMAGVQIGVSRNRAA